MSDIETQSYVLESYFYIDANSMVNDVKTQLPIWELLCLV